MSSSDEFHIDPEMLAPLNSERQLSELLASYPAQEQLEEQARICSDVIRVLLKTPETENQTPIHLLPIENKDREVPSVGPAAVDASRYVLEQLAGIWNPKLTRPDERPGVMYDKWEVPSPGFLHPKWYLQIITKTDQDGTRQSIAAFFSTKDPAQLAEERQLEHSILPLPEKSDEPSTGVLEGERSTGRIQLPNGAVEVHEVTTDGAKQRRIIGEPNKSAADFHKQHGVAQPYQTENAPNVKSPGRLRRLGRWFLHTLVEGGAGFSKG